MASGRRPEWDDIQLYPPNEISELVQMKVKKKKIKQTKITNYYKKKL